MLHSLDHLLPQIRTVDQQLIYHLIMEAQETNRLLREALPKKTEAPQDKGEFAELKRPEVMKAFARLETKPKGWNKWPTERMLEFLKEAN